MDRALRFLNNHLGSADLPGDVDPTGIGSEFVTNDDIAFPPTGIASEFVTNSESLRHEVTQAWGSEIDDLATGGGSSDGNNTAGPLFGDDTAGPLFGNNTAGPILSDNAAGPLFGASAGGVSAEESEFDDLATVGGSGDIGSGSGESAAGRGVVKLGSGRRCMCALFIV